MFEEFLTDIRAMWRRQSSDEKLTIAMVIGLPLGAAIGAISGQPLALSLMTVPIALFLPSSRAVFSWYMIKHRGGDRAANIMPILFSWIASFMALMMIDIMPEHVDFVLGRKFFAIAITIALWSALGGFAVHAWRMLYRPAMAR